MTRHRAGRQPSRKPAPLAAARSTAGTGAPRPFKKRPWLLLASSLALVAWLIFLLLMAWWD